MAEIPQVRPSLDDVAKPDSDGCSRSGAQSHPAGLVCLKSGATKICRDRAWSEKQDG